ncbi:APC family permease [Segeticoccus rhizosphaerae]|jgi:amino acid efflux transporter|uniref:APC family permease n=2 Tax=Segeticoccus rhizosphaerae TaxID=1104777 RepID=UPI0010C1006F|nr:amino acid permease [Ornithinicoccus soli]
MTHLAARAAGAEPAASTKDSGLSFSSGLAFYLGAILGTGVLALPSLAARTAGPASLLVWAGLITASVPIAWTFASLGARMPDAGGVSTYARRAFGDRVAGAIGWCFYLTIPVGIPAAAHFAGDYTAHSFGGGRVTALVTTGLIMVTVIVANALGLRTSSMVQLGVAAVLVIMLVAAVAVAIPHVDLARLQPFTPHGWSAIGQAFGLVVWAFSGWEDMSHLGGEFRSPARDLPRVTASALVVVGVLYLGLAVTTVLALPTDAAQGRAPLAALLAYGLGGAAGPITAGLAVVLTLGVVNAFAAGCAKLGAALGRDGSLPAWLGQGAAPGETPRHSLAVLAVLAFAGFAVLVADAVSVTTLVLLTTSALVTVYVVAMAAALRLLPGRGERVVAAVGLALVGLVATTFGWYLLWPAGIALAALAWTHRPSRSRSPWPGPPVAVDGRAGVGEPRPPGRATTRLVAECCPARPHGEA